LKVVSMSAYRFASAANWLENSLYFCLFISVSAVRKSVSLSVTSFMKLFQSVCNKFSLSVFVLSGSFVSLLVLFCLSLLLDWLILLSVL
jgi:hypothetical protein